MKTILIATLTVLSVVTTNAKTITQIIPRDSGYASSMRTPETNAVITTYRCGSLAQVLSDQKDRFTVVLEPGSQITVTSTTYGMAYDDIKQTHIDGIVPGDKFIFICR